MTDPEPLPPLTGFLKDAGERALKTAAQTLLAYFGAGALSLIHTDWVHALDLAGGAAVLSLLTSMASLPVGVGGTASLTRAVVPAALLEACGYGRHAEPERPRRKLGRLPNQGRPRVKLTADLLPDSLPAAPESVDWYSKVPASSWGMDGNGPDPGNPPNVPYGAGCCTLAELDHATKVLEVAAGNAEVQSKTSEVLHAYSVVTGYDPNQTDAQGNNPTDQGAEMQAVRDFWRKQGIVLGGKPHKILLFAEIDHTDLNLVKWCIARFGEVGVGVNFPASAMDQFDAGKPWTVVKGSLIDGGHAVAAVGYDDKYVYLVSWGKVVKATWAWFVAYCEEVWCQLSEEFVNSSSGVDPLGEVAYALGQQFEALTGQPNPFPVPAPQPAPAVPADWVAWAKHTLTLKSQSHATVTVAKEILDAAAR